MDSAYDHPSILKHSISLGTYTLTNIQKTQIKKIERERTGKNENFEFLKR